MSIESVLVNMFLNRFYCSEELLSYEKQIHEKYKLGDIIASHECGHRYKTKQGGIKEATILHNSTHHEQLSQKTCSVCFKLLVNIDEKIDEEIIQSVCSQEGTKNPTFTFLNNKYVFYQWLYKHLFL